MLEGKTVIGASTNSAINRNQLNLIGNASSHSYVTSSICSSMQIQQENVDNRYWILSDHMTRSLNLF